MSVNARGESEITSDILRNRRQYFIKDVKAPLLNSLGRCFQRGNSLFGKLCLLFDIWQMVISIYRYPEPTKDNTKKQMSHVLIDIWNEFFEHENNRSRGALFRAIRRVSICECEHDNYYSQRMTWFFMKLAEKYLNGEWPQREPWYPMECWNDPATQEALLNATIEFRQKLTISGRPFYEVET